MGKVLLTGASGFLGSRLARIMVEQGYPLRLLVRPGSSLGALKGIPAGKYEVVHGDVRIEHDVFRALAGCDRLLHLAAVFKMFARDPKEIFDGAIEGTRATLEAARKRDLKKVVVTSSVAAVGVSDGQEPMDEETEFNLEDSEAYIVAKRRAEEVALGYVDQDMPLVVVNPAGIFGPGDWKPTPSGESILKFLRWQMPFRFPTSEGGMNVVDVDDVAAGHLGALEKGRIGQRYILGGDNITLEQMFNILASITGLRGPGAKSSRGTAMLMGRIMEASARIFGGDPPLTYKLARDFVGRYAWVSSAKAEKELGYKHRSAREMLVRAVKWYVHHGYLSDSQLRRLRLDFSNA
ncbi:MAG: NAD-dependent epimerase/dehydratase family protein [Deltaproteobacteria bacterium]|nr:NAD-dependent epimerase/dehydratase family protein [Deltaproteobacteria bacterium]